MSHLVAIVLFAVVAAQTGAQQIKQCKCSEFEPCEKKYEDALRPCIDSCTHSLHLSDTGEASVKRCVNEDIQMIYGAMSCFRSSHMNACAHGAPKMVQKRYAETLRLAAMQELSKMVDQGAMNQVGPLLTITKKMSGCVEKCMDRAAGGCYKSMNCGLDLASDSQLIQEAKDCAIRSGFNTAVLQKLCQCISTTGIKSISSVCSHIHVL